MKITLHVSWKKYDWKDEPFLRITQFDPREVSKEDVYAGTFDLELPEHFTEPPHSDFVKAKVDDLRRQQGEKQAEITEIERNLGELMALEDLT